MGASSWGPGKGPGEQGVRTGIQGEPGGECVSPHECDCERAGVKAEGGWTTEIV